MENSILTAVKKNLGIEENDVSFDHDILTFINAVFSTLNQIGVGPPHGFHIEDKSAMWEEFLGPDPRLNSVKAYVYLKVRMLFDPPTTSFGIKAQEDLAREFEVRIYTMMEVDKWQTPVVVLLTE